MALYDTESDYNCIDETELDFNFIQNKVVDQYNNNHLKNEIYKEGQLEQALTISVSFYQLKNTIPLEDIVHNTNDVVLDILYKDSRINMYVAINMVKSLLYIRLM